jgi:hypothetical protein
MLMGPYLASHSMPGHHSLDQMHFHSCFHRICPRVPCNSLHQPFPASARWHRQLMWTQIRCAHNKAMRSVSAVARWALLIPPTGSHFRFIVSSCLKPNFPYVPFQNKRIRGFDLLADYLFAEPTTADTLGNVAYFKASDNATESPMLENDVGTEANKLVVLHRPSLCCSWYVAVCSLPRQHLDMS